MYVYTNCIRFVACLEVGKVYNLYWGFFLLQSGILDPALCTARSIRCTVLFGFIAGWKRPVIVFTCMLHRIFVATCVVYISDKVVIKAVFLVFLLFVVDVLPGELAELLPWCVCWVSIV